MSRQIPTLFSAPMVCGLIEDRKTQTRRLLKPQPFIDKMGNFCCADKSGKHVWNWGQHMDGRPCTRNYAERHARYAVGDLIWVKEAWAKTWDVFDSDEPPAREIMYRADGGHDGLEVTWRPSIFMPRFYSRLTLEVTEVRIQQVQDISEDDAKAEGCNKAFMARSLRDAVAIIAAGAANKTYEGSTYRCGYAKLWDDLNKKPGTQWHDNPWIVAVTFKVHKMNVDRFLEQRAAA